MPRCLKHSSCAALLLVLGMSQGIADPERLSGPTRYDVDYPVIAYSGPARANRVWQLHQGLQDGTVKLQWEPRFGYLLSLLDALDIDVDSQLLVFSRTSLQIEHISPQTPRAMYFNDDTYVGFVRDSPLIEIAAIDAERGSVFYGFENRKEFAPSLEREGGRCLTCHDTFAMGSGGVPRVMVLSAPVSDPSDVRTATAAQEVDDRTPFGLRWGGWYVTGDTGSRTHLGNLPLREGRGQEKLGELRATRHNLAALTDYFDTSRYPTDQSDVVALTVLEHQLLVQNLITRATFKVRTVSSREAQPAGAANPTAAPRNWEDITSNDPERMRQMVEPLVRALFMAGAAPFEDRMQGGSGFAQRFAGSGPADARGRSLRELDLRTRLFRYPLSFQIYSRQFDALPPTVRDYVNRRIVEVLQGRDTTGLSAGLSAADRQAITEILLDTKPALAALLRAN